MTEPGQELALPDTAIMPATGEVIDLNDPAECARALSHLRDIEKDLGQAKRLLSDALLAQSMIAGSKTLRAGGMKVSVRGGTETVYDPQTLEDGLRGAGMPEERIREIVIETISYSVKATEAKRAASANPAYARAVENAKTVRPKSVYVTVEGNP